MKIGQQHIGGAKPITGRDENLRHGLERLNLTGFICGAFNQPQRGSADTNNATAVGAPFIQRGSGRLIHLPPLTVHFMIFEVINLDRQKRARPDM